jgi:hypothetical protein
MSLTTEFRRFIGAVTAIVFPITDLRIENAQLGGLTLKLILRTVPAIRIPGRTTYLIAEVPTVPVAIAPEVRRNAMTTLTLECAILALETATVEFVRVVSAIIVMVTPPLTWYTFSVGTLELRLRTLSI